MLAAALRYLKLGYSVLPLAPGQKKPHARLAPHGLKDASNDPAQVVRWWREEPRAGLGLLPPAGVLVLDVDHADLVEELLKRYGLAHAPRQRSPRGGGHIFLKVNPELPLSAATKALPGTDLRGMGRAYIVAAPTTLPSGGYSWEKPLTRPEELPEAPQALLETLLPPPPPPRPSAWTGGQASPRRLRAILESFAAAVAGTPEGSRHIVLVRYARAAGGLIPHGLSREEALAVLVEAAMRAGLPEAEARAAAAWGLRAGEATPLDLGDLWPRDRFVATTLATNQVPSSTAFSPFVAKQFDTWATPGWGEEEGGSPWA